MIRDFTYIDDVVNSIVLLINKPPKKEINFDRKNPNPSQSWAPYRIFNVGNSNPVSLMTYIKAIEDCLGIKAKIKFLPLQDGDVEATSADIQNLSTYINYKPKTSLKDGVSKFLDWYKKFYDV